MKVTLITHTPEPEKIIASAAKLCYSPSNIDDLMDGLTEDKIERFVKKLRELGHESPLEHCTFTFGIEGVSRALLAQLTRHRIASYSVKSQRYVEENAFQYVTPETIKNNEFLHIKYKELMKRTQEFYNCAVSEGIPNEDARFALPNACATSLIVTMNVRSLINLFTLRCCHRAQWEIQEMANQMLGICKEVAPNLFANAGASCVRGKCKEGKMSCGNPIGGNK